MITLGNDIYIYMLLCYISPQVPEWKVRLAAQPKSDLELAEEKIRNKLWAQERASLLSKMNEAISSFDNGVEILRREKFKLDSDTKTTDLRLLTMYQELELLKKFEDKENSLTTKLSDAREKKRDVVNSITDSERQLARKLAEIKLWKEKLEQLEAEFNNIALGTYKYIHI